MLLGQARDGHQVCGEPSQYCGGRKPSTDRSHSQAQLLLDHWLLLEKIAPSPRYLGSGQAEFAEKAASNQEIYWPDALLSFKWVTLPQQNGEGSRSLLWEMMGGSTCSPPRPCPVHLPFSPSRGLLSQSYGERLWNSSLVHKRSLWETWLLSPQISIFFIKYLQMWYSHYVLKHSCFNCRPISQRR